MNEKNRLTKCKHCGSENIEERGWDIYPTDDDDVVSELQYECNDCGEISVAQNSLVEGEFSLDLSPLFTKKEERRKEDG